MKTFQKRHGVGPHAFVRRLPSTRTIIGCGDQMLGRCGEDICHEVRCHGPVPGRTPPAAPAIPTPGEWVICDSNYAVMDWTGGLWVVAGHKARWQRIFPVCRARHGQVDHCGLLDKPDDAHGAGAVETHKRIDFVDLLDEARARALRDRWNKPTVPELTFPLGNPSAGAS